jgi:hypothetical protein
MFEDDIVYAVGATRHFVNGDRLVLPGKVDIQRVELNRAW